jgi:hypothetical protein
MNDILRWISSKVSKVNDRPSKYYHLQILTVYLGIIMVFMALDHAYNALAQEHNAYRMELWYFPTVFVGLFQPVMT